ncbi:MAG: NTP transferase domain-containing protein [Leptospira sp.]|jgi:MurNAc alpha-1-phosphate uridylyltransferase|nr:NTP transferase domain-containing protein [Leptospira sp.]
MNGFILAAGFGKRMGELTKSTCKPMLSVNGIRLIDYSLYLANSWNLSKIWINTHYHSDKIGNHLKQFKKLNLFISEEKDKILGTAGGIRTALSDLEIETRLVLINPDTILLPSSDFMLRSDLPSGSKIHLYLSPCPDSMNYTKIKIDSHNKVIFGDGDLYYIGLAIIDVTILSHLERNEFYDLSDVFKILSKTGEISGEIFSGEVIDVGTKELWEKLQNQDVFKSNKDKILNFLQSH